MTSQKLLKDDWHSILNENVKGTQNIARAENAIRADSTDIYINNKTLKKLIDLGKGNSPEANFLRKDIVETTKKIIKKYGDVFKK